MDDACISEQHAWGGACVNGSVWEVGMCTPKISPSARRFLFIYVSDNMGFSLKGVSGGMRLMPERKQK